MAYKNKKTISVKPSAKSRFADFYGSNSERLTEALFEGRKFYEQNAMEDYFFRDRKKASFWHNVGFYYGRVDFDGNPIYVNESYLKQYRAPETVFGLAPVVDAYRAMTEYLQEYLVATGEAVLPTDSIFRSITPVRGWESATKLYTEHLQNIAANFNNQFLTLQMEQSITNFESFLKLFFEYLHIVITAVPFTFTAFLRSRFCNPRVSGLVLEVFDAPHDRDFLKEGFLNDEGLDFWLKVTKQFGFMVDKNAPFRLVADVTYNFAMARFMSRHDVPFGSDNIKRPFRQYYTSIYEIEMFVFIQFLVEVYNNYIESRPTIAKASLSRHSHHRDVKTNYGASTRIETIRREPLLVFIKRQLNMESDYAKKYGELFWLRSYYYIRVLEETKKSDLHGLNKKFAKHILPWYRVHGLESTMLAINQQLLKNTPRAPHVTRDFVEAYKKNK